MVMTGKEDGREGRGWVRKRGGKGKVKMLLLGGFFIHEGGDKGECRKECPRREKKKSTLWNELVKSRPDARRDALNTQTMVCVLTTQ